MVGKQRAPLPFQLQPQHHNDLNAAQGFIEVIEDRRAEFLDALRNHRRGADNADLGAEFRKRIDIGTGDAAVRHVADDGDAKPFKRNPRSRIVYRSSNAWVGCSCHPSPALITELFTPRASVSAAPAEECREDDDIGLHRFDITRRIEQRFAFDDTAGGRREIDHVGAQPFGGQLKRGPCSRARLEKEVHDGADLATPAPS